MNFSNEQIDVSDLPTLSGVNFISIEKSYRYVLLIAAGFFSLIILGGLTVLMLSEPELTDWVVG